MGLLKWKATLGVLWIIQIANLVVVALYGYWQYSGRPQYEMTIAFIIPSLMAFLSIALKDSVNRWLSLIIGLLFAGAKMHLLLKGLDQGSIGFRITELWGLSGALLIVWYALKMPKQN